MTTSIPHTHLRLRDLSELVAGVPYIIGFPPTDSLVLFTFRRFPELALSSTIRVDLPMPDHVLLVAEEMAAAVALNQAVAVIAVVIAEDGEEHYELVELLRKTLEEKNILLTHASWVPKVVHGEVWQCYDDPLCTYTVPDPQSSAMAAATAVAGDTTYPDREAMAAHLASDPEEMVAYRKKLLDAYRASPAQPYTDADLQADLEILGYALDRAANSYELPTLTDHQMVRLGRALSQGPVKDECLASALSDEPEPAERLWTVLTRGLPAPERAEPAFLLAMSAYLRGAGVIAALALKIVMESNPLHRSAVLVDYALQKGVPPDHVRNLLVESVLKNNKVHNDPADDDPPWDTTQEPTTPSTSEEAAGHPTSEPSETTEDKGQPTTVNSAPPKLRTSTAPEPPVAPADPSAHEEMPANDERLRSPVVSSVGTFVSALATSSAAVSTRSVINDGLAVGPWSRGLVPTTPLTDAVASSIGGGAPDRRTATMDALTAFLPPPTDRREPG